MSGAGADAVACGSPPLDASISASDGRAYWQSIEADVDGMLGGIPAVSKVDLQGSRAFLAKLGIGRNAGLRKLQRVLEGGAGIGRVTEGLLLPIADAVDVVEPISRFTELLKDREGVGQVFNVGLEEWAVNEGAAQATRYDLFWIQWCLGHLTDLQMLHLLQRCTSRMRDEQSLIIIKENTTSDGAESQFDQLDSSITRPDDLLRDIFERAGLIIVRTELQRAMPKELLPVRTYALRPRR